MEDDSGYNAYAAPCLLRREDFRPVVGVIGVNLKDFYFGWDNIMMHVHLILHEMMHILAFSTQLYPYFALK